MAQPVRVAGARVSGVRAHHVRRSLERGGWRTTLEYRENHVRDADGTLLAVEPRWIAEAERPLGDTRVAVATASATSQAEAWYRLRREATRHSRAVSAAG